MSRESTIIVVPIEPLTVLDARRVIYHLIAESEPNANRSNEDGFLSTSENVDLIPWTIKNKYYTADVRFSIPSKHRSSSSQADVDEIEGVEPAVIVLASSNQRPSAELETTLAELSKREPEFDVSLLVTVPPSISPIPRGPNDSTHPIEDLWDDLAISRGFEWIDLANEEEEEERGEGWDRIKDALESHLWENMERVVPSTSRESGSQNTSKEGGEGGEFRRRESRSGKEQSTVGEEGDSDGRTLEDDDDEDDFDSMGAPPLPQPRPYIPPKLEFPSTFLPSLRRSSNPPSASTLPTSSAYLGPTTSGISSEATPPQDLFDDDCSPFVEGSTQNSFSSTFPPLDSSAFTTTGLSATSPSSAPIGEEDPELEDELEHLDSLFDKIRILRERGGIELDEGGGADEETMLARRRERAEKLVNEVFGSGF